MRMFGRASAVLAISAAVVLGATGVGQASSMSIPGVAGTLNPTTNTIGVKDTACDDDSVYALWKTNGGAEQKVKNTLGCGRAVIADVPMGDGTLIYWKLCVDKSWPTADDCTPWRAERI